MGALIQRATQIHQEKSDSSERGLSIDEIERIAKDLGLDAESLRTAALELENNLPNDAGTTFWGGPFQQDLKRVFDGAMTDEQWEEIVMTARRLTGNSGKTSEIGKTKEWSHSLDEGIMHTRVSLSPRNGQTTVEIQKQYRNGVLFAYFLALFFGGFFTGISLDGSGLSDPAIFTLFGTGCLSSVAAMRFAVAHWTKRQRRKIGDLMTGISRIFSESEPESSETELVKETTESQAKIELPDLEDNDLSPVTAAKRERTS